MIFQVIGGVVFSLIGLGSIIFCRQITRLYIFLLEQLGGRPGSWYAGKMRPVRFVVTGVFFW